MSGGGLSQPQSTVPPSNMEVGGGDIPRRNNPFSLGEGFAIDEYKPIKVIVIGAGFSGILAGIRYSSLDSCVFSM